MKGDFVDGDASLNCQEVDGKPMLKFWRCKAEPPREIECDFDSTSPNFEVKYLGSEILTRPGLGEICNTVDKIYTQCKPKLKTMDKYCLTVSGKELTLRDMESTEDEEKTFRVRRILYCGVAQNHQKIFFYNYQFSTTADEVECHVVLCTTKEEAKIVAKVISKAFLHAQVEFHKREVEEKRVHARRLTLESSASGSIEHSPTPKSTSHNRHRSRSHSAEDTFDKKQDGSKSYDPDFSPVSFASSKETIL